MSSVEKERQARILQLRQALDARILVLDGAMGTMLQAHALDEAGFLGLALEEEASWLDAVLLVEAVARSGGLVDIGAAAIVGPALCGRTVPGPIAVLERGHRGPARFGAHARSLLIEDETGVRLVGVAPVVSVEWPLQEA